MHGTLVAVGTDWATRARVSAPLGTQVGAAWLSTCEHPAVASNTATTAHRRIALTAG